MVVSFVPGRIRLRFKELKNSATAELVKARIRDTPGITAVAVNSLTGSIVIEYNTAILSTEKLIQTGRQELAALNIKLDMKSAGVSIPLDERRMDTDVHDTGVQDTNNKP